MRGEQLARQWKIINLLLHRQRGMRAAELAEETETPIRNVYRDLEALQHAGFPLLNVQQGREAYWQVTETFRRTTPIPFTAQELMALEVARSLLRPLEGTIFAESVQSAFSKIHATLTEGVCEFLDQHRGSFGTAAGPLHDYGQVAEVVRCLQDGLQQQRVVELSYFAFSTGEDTRRRVEPWGLYHHAGTLYLVGHCHLRGEKRLFTVDRIGEARLLEERFERPADFDLHGYMAGAFGAFVGEPERVVLRFAPGAARYIQERVWHPSQQIERLPGGACSLALEIPVSGEIEAWIMSWGADCRVLEPAALARSIRQMHQRAIEPG